MKNHPRKPFLILPIFAGLGAMAVSRAGAQNYRAWPVSQVAAGGSHTLFTRADGTLYVMGDNTYGQLGLGPGLTNVNVPQALTNGVTLLAAGYNHSLYKRTDGSLWGMGDGSYGQLGLGTSQTNANVPREVTNGVGLIAAGWNHSLFTGGGPNHLWTMGNNAYGQLGDGTYNNHYIPEAVFTPSGTRAGFMGIAAGANHSIFATVNTSGSVLRGMGDNGFGQLGIANANIDSTNVPQVIDSPGFGPIAAGSDYSFFIETNGQAWAWGDNQLGEFGNGGNGEIISPFPVFGPGFASPSIPVVAIAAGTAHTF